MRTIVNYLDARYNLYLSNCRIEYLSSDDKNLDEERKVNSALISEIESLKTDLSAPNSEADSIRVGLIHILNGYIKAFKKIAEWGRMYPDLGQGMIIPGYLLGMLKEDLLTSLRTEGDYCPVSYIYMSSREWDYRQLQNLIEQFLNDLTKVSFKSKLDAVEYFDHVSTLINSLLDRLRKEQVI